MTETYRLVYFDAIIGEYNDVNQRPTGEQHSLKQSYRVLSGVGEVVDGEAHHDDAGHVADTHILGQKRGGQVSYPGNGGVSSAAPDDEQLVQIPWSNVNQGLGTTLELFSENGANTYVEVERAVQRQTHPEHGERSGDLQT